MLIFMNDPSKHSKFDDAKIDFNIRNDRNRIPYFLCFTPPTATYVGQSNGVDADGNPIPSRPADLEILADWIKPGGPTKRQKLIEVLVHQGQDVNEVDFHQYTGLHYACMWGWENTVDLLIRHGADVNAKTQTGKSALMFAAEFEHLSVVKALLNNPNVHINAADADGLTALIIAADLTGGDALAIARLLLESGADVNSQTLRKKTALKVACANQNVDMVNLLLDFKVGQSVSQ